MVTQLWFCGLTCSKQPVAAIYTVKGRGIPTFKRLLLALKAYTCPSLKAGAFQCRSMLPAKYFVASCLVILAAGAAAQAVGQADLVVAEELETVMAMVRLLLSFAMCCQQPKTLCR